MFLDDRKRRILQAIIDDYIDTAEPIGSRTIARRHELGLSSATIRNEMADLEDMGYIAQPHTSAGRVPSDKGYRLYVDQLMKARDLTQDELEAISAAMNPQVWVASGHVGGFSDPLIDCKDCKTRHRADKLIEGWNKENGIEVAVDGWKNDQLMEYIKDKGVKCPECGSANFTEIRKFNLMKNREGTTFLTIQNHCMNLDTV